MDTLKTAEFERHHAFSRTPFPVNKDSSVFHEGQPPFGAEKEKRPSPERVKVAYKKTFTRQVKVSLTTLPLPTKPGTCIP
jgi:hypothetical protein